MEAIKIVLTRNLLEGDWALEINGKLYHHVGSEGILQLVKREMGAADQYAADELPVDPERADIQ